MRRLAGPILIALLVLVALVWRSQGLASRPMHHDEANQAVRCGQLLDGGGYAYDPREHHGPTLYYFTLPIAWLRGQTTFAATDEATYRLLPVIFSTLTLALTLWLLRDLGPPACVWAVVFGLLSPGLFFYSRYYVQETLLVCFTFGLIVAGRRYWRTRRLRWAILAGVCLGLMHATKETCVLAWAAMGLAAVCQIRSPRRLGKVLRHPHWQHAVWFAGVAAVVSVVLFSSFFTHWRGPLDSILTYTTYLGRSGGEGRHVQSSPWYYLQLVLWQRDEGITFRPELGIAALAVIGAIAAFLRRDRNAGFARFLVLYVVLLTAIYSLLSYKTPWCILSTLHGLTLLAGLGIDAIWRLHRAPFVVQASACVFPGQSKGPQGKAWTASLACLVGLLVAGFTVRQSVLVNDRFRADERNPYVYVHTAPDLLKLVRRIEDIAAVSGEGRGLLIPVITSPEDAWPLPWYLRRFSHVGYWSDPAELPAEPAHPPVLVTSTAFDETLANRLGDGYLCEYYGLRPRQDVLLSLYIRRDLWERFLASRQP